MRSAKGQLSRQRWVKGGMFLQLSNKDRISESRTGLQSDKRGRHDASGWLVLKLLKQ